MLARGPHFVRPRSPARAIAPCEVVDTTHHNSIS